MAHLDPLAVGYPPVRAAVALAAALGLGGCASGYVAPPAYPVYLLETLKTDEQAWAAAQKQDQPVLIVGGAVYGLSAECIPARYYAQDDAGRRLGGEGQGRLLGSAADGRRIGSAGEGRLQGGAESGRLTGSALSLIHI